MSVCNILNASGANKGKIGSQFLPDLTPVNYGFYGSAAVMNVTSDGSNTELNVTAAPTIGGGVYSTYNANLVTAVAGIEFTPLPTVVPVGATFKVNFTVEFKNLQINVTYLDDIAGGQILVTRVPIYIWGVASNLDFVQYTETNPYLTFIELVVPTFVPSVNDEIVFTGLNQTIQFTDYCDAILGPTGYMGVNFKLGCPFGVNYLSNYQLSAIESISTENLIGLSNPVMNMAVSLTVMNT